MPPVSSALRSPRGAAVRRPQLVSKASPRVGAAAMALSGIGAFVGIYVVGLLGRWLQLQELDGLFLIGSFGATAVLLYGAPAAEFSQPRNVVGGHVISALVGVLVQQLASQFGFGATLQPAAAAVAFAIMAMQFTRTLHPPGGATALIAVIGSPAVHALGFGYVLSPVLLGVGLMLLVAIALGRLPGSEGRAYPRYWY